MHKRPRHRLACVRTGTAHREKQAGLINPNESRTGLPPDDDPKRKMDYGVGATGGDTHCLGRVSAMLTRAWARNSANAGRSSG